MARPNTIVVYRARWVFPVSRPPIANGVITVRVDENGLGTIVAVGSRAEVGLELVDLGNVGLIPGLINAHTHLEFSLFDRPFGQPGLSFPAWLKQVVAWRREQPAVQGQESLALTEGIKQTREAGVVAIGEIATPLFAEHWTAATSKQPGCVFLELLSLNPDRVEPLIALAKIFTHQPARQFPRWGLSPHAPYTVHPRILEQAVKLSAERKLPLTMHLAESREELQLLYSQTGELVDLLRQLGAWYPSSLSPGLKPLDYLKTLSRAHQVLVAHGNFLTPEEIEFAAMQRDRLTIVYCPRTQAYFDHDPYPLAAMLNAGARVAVGTDSRASNPDLSIWQELRFVQANHPQVSPEITLALGTQNGAEALGLAASHGTIESGKSAELARVALPSVAGDPYESLFAGELIYSSDLSNKMLID